MAVHALVPGPVTRRGDRVEVDVELVVSKGTYVRSLAEALGRSLGVPAHLGALHRTRSGALGLGHPSVVSGLIAERVRTEPATGAPKDVPPRWRLGLAASPNAAEALRTRLLPPSEVVPMPLWVVADDDSGWRALAHLAMGRTLALPDPGLPSLAAPAGLERVAVAAPPGPAGPTALVIARTETGPDGARLRAERVVVPPPGHP
jgi:tRNA pseudouridine55 synthase